MNGSKTHAVIVGAVLRAVPAPQLADRENLRVKAIDQVVFNTSEKLAPEEARELQ